MKSLQHLLYLIIFAPALLAQSNVVPLVVDVDYLSKHLNDHNLVLIEVGSKASYDVQHIAGSHFIAFEDVSTSMRSQPGELSLELLSADVLRSRFSSAGISDSSHIVIYSNKDSLFPLTTRIIFTLQYLGLGDHTSLLNGGMQAWSNAGLQVTAKVAAIKPGHLRSQPTKGVVADAALVKSISERPNYKLVDARAPAFYKGVEPTFAKSGHIPGAINIPFSEIATSDSQIDVGHLKKLFSEAGIGPGDTVVTYCHIGAQATATLFAARVLGNPVMLYDGSFQDWATNNRGGVEK